MNNEAIEKIKAIQKILFPGKENEWDGKFGPKSKEALSMASDDQERAIQGILGVEQDGIFGKRSKTALTDLIAETIELKPPTSNEEGTDAYASSFADLGDVRAFKKCKLKGNSDKFCFKVGDNGIGYGGMITGTDQVCAAALRARDIAAKYGSLAKGHGKPIEVIYKNIVQRGVIGDYMSPGLKASIDLNPGFHKAFGVNPPFIIKVKWRWVE